jgi:soluble lytic murein transglycosylase-like protein
MSTQAIGAPTAEMQAGEQAAAARMRQLQQLIEQTQAGASGMASATSVTASAASAPTDFATALAAATSSPTSAGSSLAGAAGAAGGPYDAAIEQAALRNGVDPAVLHGLIEQESGFDPNAQSSAGASGLTQLMPGTASSLGVANPLDPTESIEGGARYLGQLTREFSGNTTEALAAYNAGPGAVRQYGGVPPYAETQSYVSKVIGYAESYRAEHATTAGAVGGIA